MDSLEAQKANVKSYKIKRLKAQLLPVSVQQAATAQDRPAKGPVWISRVRIEAPTDSNVRQHFLEAVANLGKGDEVFSLPQYTPIQGEWVGKRTDTIDPAAAEPIMSESAKFHTMQNQRTSSTTILYLHGGAYFFGSPVTARPFTVPLSAIIGGCCFALRYRMAPQFPALAPQLDILVAYLNLLYPPPFATHTAIAASSIVLSGESCGASLCFALIQVILQIRRQQATSKPIVKFNGREVELPMPAGIACLSCAADVPLCLPSYINPRNKEIDFMSDAPPYREPDGRVDAIWPSSPPRGEICCEISAMAHPIMSPSISEYWHGAPPMYLACGEERFADASKLIAQRAAAHGVMVSFKEYCLMPHSFASFLRMLPQSRHCVQGWAEACKDFAESKESRQSRAVIVEAGDLQTREIDVSRLVAYSLKDALALMEAKKRTMKVWTGPSEKALL